MEDQVKRCGWVEGKPNYYLDYHDHVWGKAEHDDQELFKWLVLESFHVGLSWQLVLSKQKNFEQAFDGFDYHKIAKYGQSKIEALMLNKGIVRHRGKIEATIENAKAFQKIQMEYGCFDQYIWSFTNGETIYRQNMETISRSELSDEVTKSMKKDGFKFIGSVTIYSYLQAIGIINDHELDCHFR
ncbi:DNA-3-methyladenine glycosylase I [Facklamia sp. DSM 111018]|uniref:DNA-3-methyladenine glycosylase I n=1 Tax=Facklamia lactis TaxID=2749967 RepID=A0ABS0LSJ3_9LACT|nr:DNA-3-methyladenine glycosylase I [Facklamia lactis]MBG9981391.1 DNA-3-methyladenine glycosylase I [Facklamia lactis]MBG9987133.1 DNA-3-methyladenine glycosylase I [Facklamia lactis]